MNKLRSFISDGDGFSAKDFLMVAFIGVYIIEQVTVFILAALGELKPETLTVVQSLDTIVLTIVGGIFSVQAVKEFRNPKTDDYSYEYNQEVTTDQQMTDQNYLK